jgi:DNA-binding response OmpR family regulator
VKNVEAEVLPRRPNAMTGSTKPTILVALTEALTGNRLAREFVADYQVVSARDGLDAVVQYERLYGRVSAVVADATLPRLSGGVLAEWFHHIDPQLPVIILACEAAEDEVVTLRQYPPVLVMTKPVGAGRLKALIAALI